MGQMDAAGRERVHVVVRSRWLFKKMLFRGPTGAGMDVGPGHSGQDFRHLFGKVYGWNPAWPSEGSRTVRWSHQTIKASVMASLPPAAPVQPFPASRR